MRAIAPLLSTEAIATCPTLGRDSIMVDAERAAAARAEWGCVGFALRSPEERTPIAQLVWTLPEEGHGPRADAAVIDVLCYRHGGVESGPWAARMIVHHALAHLASSPRWRGLQVRSAWGRPTCVRPPRTHLRHWGFQPIGGVPEAVQGWMGLDLRRTLRHGPWSTRRIARWIPLPDISVRPVRAGINETREIFDV